MLGLATLDQGARFVWGLRAFLAQPITSADAHADVARRWERREDAFLDLVDQMVWDVEGSPHRALLRHAGVDGAALRALVVGQGLEGALELLRDDGVYVSYEEYRGDVPARRGSATFHWTPTDFLNPVVRADYMGSSSGTRSGGTPVGKSFAHLRSTAAGDVLHRAAWDVVGAPSAVWLPILPSSAGLNNILRLAVTGPAPERWFSHVDPATGEISGTKRLANRVLPVASRLFGNALPRPEHAPTAEPDGVLAWCAGALARGGRALLVSYPTSAVALARRAVTRGVDLDGLVIRTGGEPVTAAKVAAVERSGAAIANGYAFAQLGRVAVACPEAGVEELHVLEHHAAVVARPRRRADGAMVDALCWTSLDPMTPSVFINGECDDAARVTRDADACACAIGQLGIRTRLAEVRGLSKVVAGGITLPGERLEILCEVELPQRFGGDAGSYQFAEAERDGVTQLLVRIDPHVGPVDEGAVAEVLRDELRRDDLGVLADEVWQGPGRVVVLREAPVASRSGKVLPFEPLR